MARLKISERGNFYDPDTINLEPGTYPKNIQWAVDYDYVNQLSLEDRHWLSQFSNEYYRAAVNKDDPFALHRTEYLRKDCYNRSNASRRDLFSVWDTWDGVLRFEPRLINRIIDDINNVSNYIRSQVKRRPG